MNKKHGSKRSVLWVLSALLPAVLMAVLFFTGCPGPETPGGGTTDYRSTLSAKIEAAEALADSLQADDSDGSNTLSVEEYVTTLEKQALIAAITAAQDVLNGNPTTAQLQQAITALDTAVALVKNAKHARSKAFVFSDLTDKIAEAKKFNLIIKAASGGSSYYPFERWISFADQTAVGLETKITTAEAVDSSASAADIQAAWTVLNAAIQDYWAKAQPGTRALQDGNNIAGAYGVYILDPDSAEVSDPTANTRANQALNPSLSGRWTTNGVTTPTLELEYATPVSIGQVVFCAYASGNGTDTGITDYKIEYWSGTAWVTIYQHPGGMITGDAGAEDQLYFFTKVPFTQEYSSTRFRFNITAATSAPSFWEIHFIYMTPGRNALEKAIADAEANREATPISTDGTEIKPTNKWVTAVESNTYLTAINAANAVAEVKTSTASQLSAAKTTLDAATNIFDNTAKKAGNADPLLVEAQEEMEEKIAFAEEYLSLHKTVTGTPSTDSYYPFQWVATSDAKNDFSYAIEVAKLALSTTNPTELRASITEFDTAKTTFDGLRVVGTMANPATGTNIANRIAYATHSDRHPSVGGFSNALMNTAYSTVNPSQSPFDPFTGGRWATSDNNTLPLVGTAVFSDKISIDGIRMYCASLNNAAGSNSNGQVKNYDIEYWDDTTNDWVVCYSKTDGVTVPGLSNGTGTGGFGNTTSRGTYRHAPTFTKVTSNKFRFTFKTADTQTPSFWWFEFLWAAE